LTDEQRAELIRHYGLVDDTPAVLLDFAATRGLVERSHLLAPYFRRPSPAAPQTDWLATWTTDGSHTIPNRAERERFAAEFGRLRSELPFDTLRGLACAMGAQPAPESYQQAYDYIRDAPERWSKQATVESLRRQKSEAECERLREEVELAARIVSTAITERDEAQKLAGRLQAVLEKIVRFFAETEDAGGHDQAIQLGARLLEVERDLRAALVTEHFMLRTVGGPHPGTRVATDQEMPWPLPDELPDEGGRYVKVSESALPPMSTDSHVMRGAEYEWRPA
jgi:hypothetical protein